MIRFAALIGLCVGILVGVLGAQGSVDVPFGKAPSIDGKIDAQEWADAARHELANSVALFLKTDESHIYLAMRGSKQGWSHVYLNRDGTDVSVIHASAALGQIVYKQDERKLWQPQNEFVWEVRERIVNADDCGDGRLSREERLGCEQQQHGKRKRGRVQACDQGSETLIAAVFMSAGLPPTQFPATLADDAVKQKLLEGNAIRDLKFDVSQWARLRLPSAVSKAEGYKLKKKYELMIYAGDDHVLSINQKERDARTVQWFMKHLK